jgi:hypothetical protein
MSSFAWAVGISLALTIVTGVFVGAYITGTLGGAARTSTVNTSQSSTTNSFGSTSSQSYSQPLSTVIWSLPPPSTVTKNYNGTWRFSATEDQSELSIELSANLTYTGQSRSTFFFGEPTSIAQVVAQNGTIVWSEVTTDLLVRMSVTAGENFSSQTQIPTSSLQLGQNYTLVVYPQVSSSSGFFGKELEIQFMFSPLASDTMK